MILNHRLCDQYHKNRSGKVAMIGSYAITELIPSGKRMHTSVTVLRVPPFLLNSQLAPTDY